MSKNISVSINYQSVLDTVKRHSEYVGAKSENGDYSTIAAFDNDDEQLYAIMQETLNVISAEFAPYFRARLWKDRGEIFNLTIPDSATATKESIEAAVGDYMTHAMLQRWFSISNKGDVEHYAKEEADRLDRLRAVLWDRKHESTGNWINF